MAQTVVNPIAIGDLSGSVDQSHVGQVLLNRIETGGGTYTGTQYTFRYFSNGDRFGRSPLNDAVNIVNTSFSAIADLPGLVNITTTSTDGTQLFYAGQVLGFNTTDLLVQRLAAFVDNGDGTYVGISEPGTVYIYSLRGLDTRNNVNNPNNGIPVNRYVGPTFLDSAGRTLVGPIEFGTSGAIPFAAVPEPAAALVMAFAIAAFVVTRLARGKGSAAAAA